MLIDENQFEKIANPKTKPALIGYRRANQDFVCALKDILNNAVSYSELKKQIDDLCKARESFIDFSGRHLSKSVTS